MRAVFFCLLLFCTLFFPSCQKNEDQSLSLIGPIERCLVLVNGEYVEVKLDEMPVYLDGGNEGFGLAMLSVIRYPPEARENGIQGLCRVSYDITEDGTVEALVILEDPGGGIGEATFTALETVTAGVSFSPAILHQAAVRVRKELSVRFKLQ